MTIQNKYRFPYQLRRLKNAEPFGHLSITISKEEPNHAVLYIEISNIENLTQNLNERVLKNKGEKYSIEVTITSKITVEVAIVVVTKHCKPLLKFKISSRNVCTGE